MASAQKISELTTAGPLTGAELVPIVQSGGTLQTTVSTLVAFANVSLLPVVSALQTQINQVSAATSVNAAAIASTNVAVDALEVRVSTVSALAVATSAALTSTNTVINALEVRVSAASATGVANAAAITSINNVVSALEVRVSSVSARASTLDTRITAVSASVSALQIQINAVSAALTSTNNVVSALEIRVSTVSARASALDTRLTAVSASVSALQIQVNTVSAALTSTNNVVSALEIRVSAASATGVTNAAAITSINNVVSALEIRVSAASATGAANTAAITSVNNVVSALEIRVSSVSAAVVSTNNVVSALEIRVSAASATGSANSAAITSINNAVSVLEVRVSVVEVALSAIGDVSAIATLVSTVALLDTEVSVLEIRVSAVSAVAAANSAAITSVNAVVSLKVNRVGDFMDSVQYIEFNTSTAVSSSAGRLSWSLDEGTLDIGFDNQGVVLHTGLQLYQRVYNDTAATLTKGTVIRVTGSQGQRLTAAPALANNDVNSATTFAFLAENVSVNNSGFAITEGVLKNVNTSGIADGATLWLSPVSAGVYTPTKPVAPQHLVPVGFVVKGNSAGAGSIYVKIINGLELGELHDVKVSSSTSLANGEVLAYDTSAGVWTNSLALINAQASISALNVQIAAVSALTSVNAASITSTNNVVSALEIRVSTVSAQASAIQSQVNAVSALVSTLDIRVAAVSASVSALQVQLNAVSAALTSTNNVVSALEVRVSSVSAAISVNTVAINTVSAAVSLRILRAGDTMTGVLGIVAGTAAAPGLTFSGDTNTGIYSPAADTIAFSEGGVEAMRLDANGRVGIGTASPATLLDVNGVIRDSKGDVRAIPQSAQGGAYTLAIGDVGRHISISTGGVTVPASVFSAGDAITIYNNSGSNQTITQGASVTLRQAGTANTGNRTLAQYGVCTVLCVASNTFVISGAGLT